VPTETSRRRFQLIVIYGLGAIIACLLALPAALYLLLPPRLRRKDEWIDAGDLAKMDLKAPVEVVFRKNRLDGWKLTSEKSTAWVVQSSSNQIIAFGPQCTHLGCAYHFEEDKKEFLCPCHNSVFALDGSVVSGPAPRPLDRYEVKVQNQRLLLGALKESDGTSV
jgi:menaquinol-cytochrome c reductase iron-sulfur subunit